MVQKYAPLLANPAAGTPMLLTLINTGMPDGRAKKKKGKRNAMPDRPRYPKGHAKAGQFMPQAAIAKEKPNKKGKKPMATKGQLELTELKKSARALEKKMAAIETGMAGLPKKVAAAAKPKEPRKPKGSSAPPADLLAAWGGTMVPGQPEIPAPGDPRISREEHIAAYERARRDPGYYAIAAHYKDKTGAGKAFVPAYWQHWLNNPYLQNFSEARSLRARLAPRYPKGHPRAGQFMPRSAAGSYYANPLLVTEEGKPDMGAIGKQVLAAGGSFAAARFSSTMIARYAPASIGPHAALLGPAVAVGLSVFAVPKVEYLEPYQGALLAGSGAALAEALIARFGGVTAQRYLGGVPGGGAGMADWNAYETAMSDLAADDELDEDELDDDVEDDDELLDVGMDDYIDAPQLEGDDEFDDDIDDGVDDGEWDIADDEGMDAYIDDADITEAEAGIGQITDEELGFDDYIDAPQLGAYEDDELTDADMGLGEEELTDADIGLAEEELTDADIGLGEEDDWDDDWEDEDYAEALEGLGITPTRRAIGRAKARAKRRFARHVERRRRRGRRIPRWMKKLYKKVKKLAPRDPASGKPRLPTSRRGMNRLYRTAGRAMGLRRPTEQFRRGFHRVIGAVAQSQIRTAARRAAPPPRRAAPPPRRAAPPPRPERERPPRRERRRPPRRGRKPPSRRERRRRTSAAFVPGGIWADPLFKDVEM